MTNIEKFKDTLSGIADNLREANGTTDMIPFAQLVNQSAGLANKAKMLDAVIDEMSIKDAVSGSTITITDADDAPLHGLTLYGKTTQNGTPTPEAPAELVSVGDDGSVGVTVAGKNLAEITTYTATALYNTMATLTDTRAIKKGEIYTVSIYLEAEAETIAYWNGDLEIFDLAKITVRKGINRYSRTFTALADGKSWTEAGYSRRNVINKGADDGIVITGYGAQIEHGSAATAYEPYKGQTLTASTPNGLPGIPVSSGGNYTDANGQQWVCDEVDFGRGKYVQRVNRVTADTVLASGKYSISTSAGIPCIDIMRSYNLGVDSKVLCNCYVQINTSVMGTHGTFKNWQKQITIYDARFTSLEQATSLLREADFIMLLRLATPIETDLSAEELAAFSALHTNTPTTTVYNDAGAHMDVKYYGENAVVPINMGVGAKGKVLSVNENGYVVAVDMEKRLAALEAAVAALTTTEASEE